jgi:chromosome segregation ATPase
VVSLLVVSKELEEARAELQKAHNAVSAEAQAVENLEEEKQRMEATIAELKAAQTEVRWHFDILSCLVSLELSRSLGVVR